MAERNFFSKVKIARELLRDKAEDIFNEYMQVTIDARNSGDLKLASDNLKWLIEHMPKDEDGNRMVEAGVDKNIEPVKVDTRPAIQIGINLGGVGRDKKELPKAEVIDAE